MDLIDLANEMGLEPRKTSSCQGGEYHCPCPSCGGDDRFMFWPINNRYWCRQCNVHGDDIQFCRDFQKLSFRDACLKTKSCNPIIPHSSKKAMTKTLSIHTPSHSWEEKAKVFIESSFNRLLVDKNAMKSLIERGLTLETIKKNRLGWNPIKAFYRRAEWGLEETEKQKWICLPKGLVIPLFEKEALRKIKIRKSEWEVGDQYGKYYEVPGSSNLLPIFGLLSQQVVVIIEAEFDAMLIDQEARTLCACIALGGAQKRPHPSLRDWLSKKQLILFALDFDEAGKKEYAYWQKHYPNLEPWPIPEEKSPGDYFTMGGSIKDWIIGGIKNALNQLYL